MGASFDEIVREAEEGSGCTRGEARFQLEKRQRTREGPAAIETQDREGQPHKTKRPYSDEEDDQAQATPITTIRSNPDNNVPTPLCTTPNSGKPPSPTC